MIKAKKAVILGTGSFADVVTFMLEKDSDYEVVGYTASQEFVKADDYLGKPLVPFENLEDKFKPENVEIFVAIGYSHMNTIREKYMHKAKDKGYRLLSYVSSRAQHWGDIKVGENVFIFENNNIQPYVEIGDGTILWSGNHIGHHAKIGKYCFITSHVVVSGHCTVGDNSFIGVNATLADNIAIADRNLLGAGALIVKDTKPDEVYAAEKTKVLSVKSERFFR